MYLTVSYTAVRQGCGFGDIAHGIKNCFNVKQDEKVLNMLQIVILRDVAKIRY